MENIQRAVDGNRSLAGVYTHDFSRGASLDAIFYAPDMTYLEKIY